MFAFSPRCHGLSAWAKNTPSQKSSATLSCEDISEPWSQVNVERAVLDKPPIVVVIAAVRLRALWSIGGCTSLRYLLCRSTMVPIADQLALPTIRSPSLWPTRSRRCAASGRWSKSPTRGIACHARSLRAAAVAAPLVRRATDTPSPGPDQTTSLDRADPA